MYSVPDLLFALFKSGKNIHSCTKNKLSGQKMCILLESITFCLLFNFLSQQYKLKLNFNYFNVNDNPYKNGLVLTLYWLAIWLGTEDQMFLLMWSRKQTRNWWIGVSIVLYLYMSCLMITQSGKCGDIHKRWKSWGLLNDYSWAHISIVSFLIIIG